MLNPVAILGVGQTKHGRRQDVSYPELVQEAVKRAIEVSKISLSDIDAIVSGSMPAPMEGVNAPHLYLADAFGAKSKPLVRTATCGSTGMSVAQTAFYHVASGMFDTVIAIGHQKMHEGDPQATMTTVADPWFQRYFIGDAPSVFTMQGNQYANTYNLPFERVRNAAATISVKHHESALNNPYAHIRQKITVEDVLGSRIVSYPTRLLDICPSSDGACAIIFTSKERAKKIGEKVAWVKGLSYSGDEHFFGDSNKVKWLVPINAAKESYKMAGIQNPRKELDVAEVYNPFTFQELIWYECFGFCDEGKACDLVEKGVVFRGGELPCDPSGGTLCTNPIGATGLLRVGEAALQVMGKAEERQIPHAKTAFASAMGGESQFVGVMILSNEL